MNRTVTILAGVIVVLIAVTAFLLGRQTQSPIPTSQGGTTPVAVVAPTVPTRIAPVQSVAVADEQEPWADGSPLKGYCSLSSGGVQFDRAECEGSFGVESTILSLGRTVGCNVFIEKNGNEKEARLENFREKCQDSRGVQPPIDGIALGVVRFRNGCWINERLEFCFKA